jgi:hypothetical protein
MKRVELNIKRVELVTMEICHTHCIFCQKDCYKEMIFIGDCGHSFCIECSVRVYQASQLSPAPFGGPACPNGCLNPKQGPQCECEEQETVLTEWEQKDPQQYRLWNSQRIAYSYSEGIFCCPVCKNKSGL